MSPASAETTTSERLLLTKARAGDEAAFAQLIEPRRGELHAHCYRMLGSLHDAEDALQDAFLRAWRALARLEDGTAMRAWLYRIATNTCLDIIAKRPKRVIPIDQVAAGNPADGPAPPSTELVWLEPYPDEILAVEDGYASPEASYEQREALELAFIAALQHLPASQRAVLILREVLGFSAKEVAASLETSVASVNSLLQRARRTVDERMPEKSQQETIRALGDEKLQEIVTSYMEAMQRADVPAVVSMLTDDAAWSMPPSPSWYGGLRMVEQFLRVGPLSGDWRWRHHAGTANGQLAIGVYHWDEDEKAHLPFALDVLTLEGDKIKDVTAFIVRTEDLPPDAFPRWPEQDLDPDRVESVFVRLGFPQRLV